MCFTPIVSISIAIIEFILATTLLLLFPKRILRNFSATLIYILGFYQFTEFMLCTTSHPIFWAKAGFMTYTLLPAIVLHTTLKFTNKKPNYFLLYLIPVIFEIMAFSLPIVVSATCPTFFVEVTTLLYASNHTIDTLLAWSYSSYYFFFIIISCVLFYLDRKNSKNKRRKKIDIIEMLGVILMTVPTVVFIFILPYLGKRFPSVLCGFAIFVTVTSFIAVYLDSNINKK